MTSSARADLPTDVVDPQGYARTVERFAEQGIRLPTFAELADPDLIDSATIDRLASVNRDAADPANLFRVHWHNSLDGGFVDVPEHVVLPPELTGVPSPIVLAFGNRFPMIGAHKVLAAYSCLVPRVVSGQFDPTRHRAVWPSTGNYARGGVAISRLMACRGVAVLPENMSRERFEWLDAWVPDPEDVIRTPGSESNVKEIYDACAVLAQDPGNFILNQFSEFSNHIGHYEVTGAALGQVFESLAADNPDLRLAAFVSASGSAGTLGAGDRLKDDYGSQIVAVEALECPTMLYNGFGEHNIQGIGDKHIPLIHNVTNTDVVVAISDAATDGLGLVFNTDAGRDALREHLGSASWVLDELGHLGFSSICNALAAIKTARVLGLGADDVIITVATDGYELYRSEREEQIVSRFDSSFGADDAQALLNEHLLELDVDHVEVLDARGRDRVFNLGYFTWVEQQGTPFDLFVARHDQEFWNELRGYPELWDEMIREFNAATGLG